MTTKQGDLFEKPVEVKTDLCAGKHGGAETSAEAYATTPKETREAQTAKILWLMKSRPNGTTCDEAELILGLSHQTCSARITELCAKESIRYGDERRTTRAGKMARVYFPA